MIMARTWILSSVMAMVVSALAMTSLQQDLKLLASMELDPALLIRHGKSAHALVQQHTSGNITAQYASIPIDHENSSLGTYKNRYWTLDQYYRQGGPVFVYDVGEANAAAPAKLYLGNSTLFFCELLQEFGGLGIVWEHRYYGDSLPFPVNNATPPEHFKYLTNKQALADLPYFAKSFSHPEHKTVDLTPKSTPWVMVGGSYAGMRAAFSRDKYPDTFFASWSSSSPVEARVDMSIYFEQVYDGLVANGYLNCTKDIKAAFEYIDGQLGKNSTTAAAIKKKFFGEGAEENNNGDFTAALAGIMSIFQSFGLGGGEGGLGDFCHYLTTDPKTLAPAGPGGFAPYRGKEWIAEHFSAWPAWTDLINKLYNTNCKRVDPSLPLSCVLNPPATDPDTISWTWQYCTEWGYFQSNNFGPHSLLSSYQTLAYQQEYCNQQFPDAIAKSMFPKRPMADAMNNDTGGWSIRPSNTYFSGGQFDPWRTLSTLATESIAPKNVDFTTDIPKCNVKTEESTVFGYILPNAEHCFDFRSNFASAKKSRQLFYQALHSWLPCFKSTKGATGIGNGGGERNITLLPRKRIQGTRWTNHLS